MKNILILFKQNIYWKITTTQLIKWLLTLLLIIYF